MKATLDLDKLRRENRITQQEYTRLQGFAAIAIAMTLVRYNRGNLGNPGSPAFSGQS